jgi:hypothetical protein
MDSGGELVGQRWGDRSVCGGLPRSINHMTPGNSFVQALASIPVAPGIAVNSIVAVKGEAGGKR